MKHRFLNLTLLLLLPLLAAGVRTGGGLVGGWKPIENPKDPHVVEIGQFAVTEYNKQSKATAQESLKFQSVEKAEAQLVSGTNYRLILAAKDGMATNNYEAVVWENPLEHFKILTSFNMIII